MPRNVPARKQEPTLDIGQLIRDSGKERVQELIEEQIESWVNARARLEISYDVHRRIKSQRLKELEAELEACGPAIAHLEQMLADVEAYQEPETPEQV